MRETPEALRAKMEIIGEGEVRRLIADGKVGSSAENVVLAWLKEKEATRGEQAAQTQFIAVASLVVSFLAAVVAVFALFEP